MKEITLKFILDERNNLSVEFKPDLNQIDPKELLLILEITKTKLLDGMINRLPNPPLRKK